MKRKPSKTGFNKLLGSECVAASTDPLIGLITLDCDNGEIELVMNRIVAERLMDTIVEFLQKGEGDDAPTFAVERTQ